MAYHKPYIYKLSITLDDREIHYLKNKPVINNNLLKDLAKDFDKLHSNPYIFFYKIDLFYNNIQIILTSQGAVIYY